MSFFNLCSIILKIVYICFNQLTLNLMKKIFLGMLFGLAFTVTANAQEAKQGDSKPAATEKKACCASDKASASKDAKACPYSASATTAPAASCSSAATKATTAQASTQAAPAAETKKSCSTGSSCCADKAKKV